MIGGVVPVYNFVSPKIDEPKRFDEPGVAVRLPERQGVIVPRPLTYNA